MFRKSLLLIIASLVTTVALAAGDVLYKWKDADGNTKFGDRPPKGVPYERIKVRQSKGGQSSTAITEKMDAQKQDNSDVEKQLSAAKEQLNQACEVAKINMKTLNTSGKIKVAAEDGGTRYLTDVEIEEKKKETQEQIDEFCNDKS